jgi:hypothetical protein
MFVESIDMKTFFLSGIVLTFLKRMRMNKATIQNLTKM